VLRVSNRDTRGSARRDERAVRFAGQRIMGKLRVIAPENSP